jgi:hypothetical protein
LNVENPYIANSALDPRSEYIPAKRNSRDAMTERKKWQIAGIVVVALAYLGGIVGWTWAALSVG